MAVPPGDGRSLPRGRGRGAEGPATRGDLEARWRPVGLSHPRRSVLRGQRSLPPRVNGGSGRSGPQSQVLSIGPSQFVEGPTSGRRDLNPRPPAPKAGALPSCATSRLEDVLSLAGPRPSPPYSEAANQHVPLLQWSGVPRGLPSVTRAPTGQKETDGAAPPAGSRTTGTETVLPGDVNLVGSGQPRFQQSDPRGRGPAAPITETVSGAAPAPAGCWCTTARPPPSRSPLNPPLRPHATENTCR